MCLKEAIFSLLFVALLSNTSAVENGPSIYFYYGTNCDHEIFDYTDLNEIVNHREYNKNLITVLYIHGYLESATAKSGDAMTKALCTRNDLNKLVFDYARDASGLYPISVRNAMRIGKILGNITYNTIPANDFGKIHLIGHSMGGQLAGQAGRTVKELSNDEVEIGRITALDPAGPLFYGVAAFEHLSRNDASFVDVIHTDAAKTLLDYGYPYETGTVDFWPNSGQRVQPGCAMCLIYLPLSDKSLCSHRKSYEFFAQSLMTEDPKAFLAISAESWDDFKDSMLDDSDTVQMGFNCPQTATGSYYLQTDEESPFSRGTDGTTYDESILKSEWCFI